ncbi:MAG: response regulator transcription factor [Chloroflexi bacterium]|nr:response regulator transcription factor [Chloroflexota bacterium]
MASILVVEDEPSLLSTVAFNLRREGYRVLTAADGEAGLATARRERPDLLILDLMLPRLDGLEVCRRLRQESAIPILMLTAKADEVDRVVGLELGADDYVTKPFNPRELVARVKAVLRRSRQETSDEPVIEANGLVLDVARREVTVEGAPVTLRAKEFDLLTAFMRHPGIVLDRERLLQLVWGSDYYGDTRTIDVHVAWLREKLAAAQHVKIQTVWGVGYKLVVESDAAQS